MARPGGAGPERGHGDRRRGVGVDDGRHGRLLPRSPGAGSPRTGSGGCADPAPVPYRRPPTQVLHAGPAGWGPTGSGRTPGTRAARRSSRGDEHGANERSVERTPSRDGLASGDGTWPWRSPTWSSGTRRRRWTRWPASASRSCAGEVFGFLGPNGAGKSTTIGILTTRIVPTRGRAVVAGVDVVADPVGARRVLGVVPQQNNLDRSLSVRQNLLFHASYHGVPRAERVRRPTPCSTSSACPTGRRADPTTSREGRSSG